MELRKETKSIGLSEKYFRAVATPNREKPKEEETSLPVVEFPKIVQFCIVFQCCSTLFDFVLNVLLPNILLFIPSTPCSFLDAAA